MSRRTRFDAALDKRAAVNSADSSGSVADSMEVREGLLSLVRSGEITLEECQRRLKLIKRNAKKNGLTTRAQVWSRS